MKFIVESRGTITQIAPKESHVIFSISDTREARLETLGTDTTKDILYLYFHDANIAGDGIDLFNDSHADQILNFYLRYRDEVQMMVAHCYAGMCRSPAVIAALQRIHLGHDDDWFARKRPNTLVYRTILNRAYDRNLLRL